MSIFKLDSGYRVVADRFLLEGKGEEERADIVKRMLLLNFRANEYINIIDGSHINIACKNKELRKMDRPGLAISEAKYRIRQAAITHLDELLETSRFVGFEEDCKGKHGLNVLGFEKREVEFEICNLDDKSKPFSQVFRMELTICCKTDIKIAYDISRINKKDAYSVLPRSVPATAERYRELDKASLYKKITHLPGFVKTNDLPISKFIIDREPEDGDVRRLMAASRQERRACLAKDLKRHGFIPEKMVLDKMEALGGLLHCRVGVKEVNSWYKSRIFDGNDEVNGLIKNLAEDLRRQELYRGRLPPEGPIR